MNNEEIKIIKETISTLLDLIGIPLEGIEINDSSYYKIGQENLPEEAISVNIKSEEPGILIGERGTNLSALQHLVRLIVKVKLGSPIYFILDVNSYKAQKIERLRILAENVAKAVSRNRRAFILQPMRAYDRRIIHLSLAARKDITTTSVGEEPERRVTIKPT